jgi:uncharacterized protein (DUF1501 family)
LRQPVLTRRAALLGLTSAWTLGHASLALANAPTNQRFVVIILRGALDGMAAIVPYGDAALATWRQPLIPAPIGTPGGMLDLGGFYGLHPALAALHPLYVAGDLLPVHAIAGHYRSRSHFEAQDYMESGADHRMTGGWLNRVAAALPRPAGTESIALSAGLSMPLLLRGAAPVASYAPEVGPCPSPDLYARIADLNASDRIVGPALAEGLRARGFSASVLDEAAPPGPAAKPAQGPAAEVTAFAALARSCGELLAAPGGPRIAALEIGGWDTHVGQIKRLDQPLQDLAAGLLGLKDGLGGAWRQTVVMVMTEFGRTVRENGTGGTDHGTGTVAFAAGGAVAGGRIAGAWPGLARDRLLEDRDLQPTSDLRSLAKGLLAQHLRLSGTSLAQVFPDSGGAPPMPGLLRQTG